MAIHSDFLEGSSDATDGSNTPMNLQYYLGSLTKVLKLLELKVGVRAVQFQFV